MKNSTGLDRLQFQDLIDLLADSSLVDKVPPILGMVGALKVTLKYLRRNRTQADIADGAGVSQPTISRAVSTVTEAIAAALSAFIPTVEDVPDGTVYLVDGTLLPCWSWADRPELYSGKHHTTGVNVQVVADTAGRIAWVSDPLPGRTHDVAALDEHGFLDMRDPSQCVGDKGYIGRGMTTPERKPPHGELTEHTKHHNTQINQIRWPIEQAIGHLKNWRILHTDYRRPFHTFAITITAVIGLHFLYA
jgi:hypothetical protein